MIFYLIRKKGNNMKRSLAVALAGSMLMSAAAHAEGWTFLAGMKPDYKAEPALSLIAGQMSPGTAGLKDGTITGIELSLNCPLLQPPTNRIRQQVSVTQYDESGTKITNIELNPHYVVEVSPGLELGGGPGLGYITTKTSAQDPSFWGLSLGLSAHYTAMGPLFLGAEYRYQVTTKEDFGGSVGKDNLNNGRFDVKVGYSF
jgi:opacity protein-like surface antigen